MIKIKRKKYTIDVRSHVSGLMTVFANSAQEAWEIASKDMEESLKRQLDQAKPHPLIKDLHGYTKALRTSVKMVHE